MGEEPGGWGSQPARVVFGGGDAAIERQRDLGHDPGSVVDDPPIEIAIERGGFVCQQTGGNLDSGGAQQTRSAARMRRVGISRRENHAGDFFPHDELSAGRSATVSGAGFQGDVERCARGREVFPFGIRHGLHLRVRRPSALVMTFANHLPAAHQNRADLRIGQGQAASELRELQSAAP